MVKNPLLFLIFLMGFGAAWGQRKDQYPLRGKTVAVYLSKRHFNFNDHYRIPLTQFIKADQGATVEIDDLKIQTLISIGNLFSAQLAEATQADSVYFLNADPERGRAFMAHFSPADHSMVPVPDVFAGTDYILVVNPLVLGVYTTSAVYTRSNRLITQKVVNKSARIRLELYDPATGLLLQTHEACVDQHKTRIPEPLFEFHMENSKTGKFLGKVFSAAVINLNTGQETSCGVEEQ